MEGNFLLTPFASVSQVPGSFAALTLANSGYLARFRLASPRKAGASAPRPPWVIRRAGFAGPRSAELAAADGGSRQVEAC